MNRKARRRAAKQLRSMAPRTMFARCMAMIQAHLPLIGKAWDLSSESGIVDPVIVLGDARDPIAGMLFQTARPGATGVGAAFVSADTLARILQQVNPPLAKSVLEHEPGNLFLVCLLDGVGASGHLTIDAATGHVVWGPPGTANSDSSAPEGS